MSILRIFAHYVIFTQKKKPRFTILFANLGKKCYLCGDISHIRDYHHNYKPTLNYQTMYNKKRARCKDFTYYCEVSYKIDEVYCFLRRHFSDLSPFEIDQLCIVICNQYADTGLLSFESLKRSGDHVFIRPYRLKFLHKDADTICLWWRPYSLRSTIYQEF